jgi:hypothetical protein
MKQDRFLTGILVGIGVLIVAALVVFFTRQKQPDYMPDGTPDGVVHNYVLAVMRRDYERAYTYLADLQYKPTYKQFHDAFSSGRLSPGEQGIRVGPVSISGEDATVDVTMLSGPSDPFSERYGNLGYAQLVQQGGAWKISSMPTYNLWDYSWYKDMPKP